MTLTLMIQPTTGSWPAPGMPPMLVEHARIWNGVSPKGVKCWVLVLGVAVDSGADAAEFVELGTGVIPPGLDIILDDNGRDGQGLE